MGKVELARTSPTLHPHPLPVCCNYPVYKCPSASIIMSIFVCKYCLFCILVERPYLRFCIQDDPLEPGLRWLPLFYGVTIIINIFSIFYEGTESKILKMITMLSVTVTMTITTIVTMTMVATMMTTMIMMVYYACLDTCCSHFLTVIAGVDLHVR